MYFLFAWVLGGTPGWVHADALGMGDSAELRSDFVPSTIAGTWLAEMPLNPDGQRAQVQVTGCPAEHTKQIRSYFQTGLEQSLKCLRDADLHPSVYTALRTVDQLMVRVPSVQIGCTATQGVMPSGAKIDGDVYAMSSFHDTKGFPFVTLNTSNLVPAASVENLLLHEVLHWTGFGHYSGPDLSYLGPGCCPSNEKLRGGVMAKQACAFLRLSPEEWDRAENLQAFSIWAALKGVANTVRAKTLFGAWARLRLKGTPSALEESDKVLQLLEGVDLALAAFWRALRTDAKIRSMIPANETELMALWVQDILGERPMEIVGTGFECKSVLALNDLVRPYIYLLGNRVNGGHYYRLLMLTSNCAAPEKKIQ